MQQRSPLKKKRETPRRNEGRVQQVRVKPRAKAAPNAAERRHMERLARMGCLVCGADAELHHVMTAPGKVRRRDHARIAPLCGEHHRGRFGVHGLGSETMFADMHGIDLAKFAVRAWEDSNGATEIF